MSGVEPRRATKRSGPLEDVYVVDEKDNIIRPPFRNRQIFWVKIKVDYPEDVTTDRLDESVQTLCLIANELHYKMGFATAECRVINKKAHWTVEADRFIVCLDFHCQFVGIPMPRVLTLPMF
jgi:hypothetical protein